MLECTTCSVRQEDKEARALGKRPSVTSQSGPVPNKTKVLEVSDSTHKRPREQIVKDVMSGTIRIFKNVSIAHEEVTKSQNIQSTTHVVQIHSVDHPQATDQTFTFQASQNIQHMSNLVQGEPVKPLVKAGFAVETSLLRSEKKSIKSSY